MKETVKEEEKMKKKEELVKEKAEEINRQVKIATLSNNISDELKAIRVIGHLASEIIALLEAR